uniref:YbaK/aminoacyl-tRNA synthetase-associated domain-containing protein n=1 Tax=Chlorobium chlorochromatii (strain CaD3) TaxID=340177 RepID=Q3APR8_CHLCH
MPVRKLRDFLDRHKVHYFVVSHSPAYTAQEIAASAHVPGNELAKTVMVMLDGEFAMAVLPASRLLDLRLLQEVSGATHVALAKEDEFAELFPECEVGAMPPFGNLYGMKVFVSEELEADDDIAFNAGGHRELLILSYKRYKELVQPIVAKLS